MRIIIIVEGGVVQAVHSDEIGVQVDLIDWDNNDAESTTQNEALAEVAKEMNEVF